MHGQKNIKLNSTHLYMYIYIYVYIYSVLSDDGSIINQLTPWSRVLPEKLKCPQVVKKFPEFYGI